MYVNDKKYVLTCRTYLNIFCDKMYTTLLQHTSFVHRLKDKTSKSIFLLLFKFENDKIKHIKYNLPKKLRYAQKKKRNHFDFTSHNENVKVSFKIHLI